MLRLTGFVCGFLLLLAASGYAQAAERAVPAPARPQSFVLEKIGLEVVIEGQKAACTLQYVIYNPTDRPLEVDFLAPLPSGGTVTGLTLFDGQKEMPGKVYDKDEAWDIYREIVAKAKDPALLEYAGRDTFRARVFPVPAKGRQTLDLRFDYLVPKADGQAAFSFPIAGPMVRGGWPEQDIRVIVRDAPGLGGLYSPLAGADIRHQPGQDAAVTYQSRDTAPPDVFRLYFRTEASPLGGLILSHKPEKDEDGFFLFLADPRLPVADQQAAAKNIIFALDESGSMSGAKFKQAQEALRFLLERLDERDNFNLVNYESRVSAWKPELMDMSPENRRSALAYVDNLRSGGGTNIDEALKLSFSLTGDTSRPNYVVFLTDGQPTEGEVDEMRLAEIARKANPGNAARLFAFGVGHDVNARLLDRLSGQAGGSSVFVNPDENLEAKVSSFFSRITTPALIRPSLSVSRAVNRVLPEQLPDLFVGQQLVVVGRYPSGGESAFTLTGRIGEKEQKFEYKASLADGPSPDGQFIASLWAQRRIGELIDQLDLAGGAPNPELVAELTALSKKYGILTPYTSFLALEDQNISRQAELEAAVGDNLSIMAETVGAKANAQRAFKAEMTRKPVSATTAYNVDFKDVEAMAQLDKRVAAAMPAAAESSYEWDAGGAALAIPYDRNSQESANQNRLSLPNLWAGQTFFFKNGRWQAENLSDDDLKKLTAVKQL
ncbi:MAG: VIT and VWA domain-containing protein, partial [Candidatus Adiutrix sp.]|nr:VIT and VWA domain-containing protein [Candidatus Adiutrix sp.]